MIEYICDACGGRLSMINGGQTLTRGGYSFRTRCPACGKRITLHLDLNFREVSRHETRKQKGDHSRPSQCYPTTICWKCQRACGGPGACSWFRNFEPVPGWEAVERILDGKGENRGKPSYSVLKCPEFVAMKNKKAGA